MNIVKYYMRMRTKKKKCKYFFKCKYQVKKDSINYKDKKKVRGTYKT